MDLEVRIHNTDLTAALRAYIDRRLRFSISRYGQLGRVTVRVSDLNGPRGGPDKCCRIVAELMPSGMVVLQVIDADLFGAIDRAVDRVGRALARQLARARELRTGRETVRTEGVPIRRLTRGRR